MRYFLEHLSLFVFILIINFASSSPNHERDLGDFCLLENNEQGVCRRMQDCDYAKKMFVQRKTNELLKFRCKFLNINPLICCPSLSDVRIDSTKKYSKFKNALCENETPEIQLQLNIIGGEHASVGEFPYFAAIGFSNSTENNNFEYKCGGSLIANDIVITAAHCVNRVDTIPRIVKLGRTSLVESEDDYSDGDDIEIEYVKIHPDYKYLSKLNDIALLKLKRAYNDSSYFIKPICLSSNDENLPKNFTIAGFGRNDINTQNTSDWLLKAIVNEYPLNKCQELYKEASNQNIIFDSHFCAFGYKGADSCQGDSGGPLSYEVSFGGGKLMYLYGVVSTGIGCGSPIPGIYTRINKYLDWIETEMNLME